MQHSEFVHLHVHSEYSLLDGAAQLEKLVLKAKELRFPALALTDHGSLFGAIDFYLAAQKAGIKPIIGCELYVAPGSRKERGSQDGGYEGANHLTVLVRNRAGYRDRKSTRLNSSHGYISYAVFCLKKKKNEQIEDLTQSAALALSQVCPAAR